MIVYLLGQGESMKKVILTCEIPKKAEEMLDMTNELSDDGVRSSIHKELDENGNIVVNVFTEPFNKKSIESLAERHECEILDDEEDE